MQDAVGAPNSTDVHESDCYAPTKYKETAMKMTEFLLAEFD